MYKEQYHPIVSGMYFDENSDEYVVFSDNGIDDVDEIERFSDKDKALSFLQMHPLPVGNWDKWIWDIEED